MPERAIDARLVAVEKTLFGTDDDRLGLRGRVEVIWHSYIWLVGAVTLLAGGIIGFFIGQATK